MSFKNIFRREEYTPERLKEMRYEREEIEAGNKVRAEIAVEKSKLRELKKGRFKEIAGKMADRMSTRMQQNNPTIKKPMQTESMSFPPLFEVRRRK